MKARGQLERWKEERDKWQDSLSQGKKHVKPQPAKLRQANDINTYIYIYIYMYAYIYIYIDISLSLYMYI